MTIQQFNINKIKQTRSRSIKTNYNTDLNSKLFLDPNLVPLFPVETKLVQFGEDSYVIEEVAEQYKKFTDLITRKIYQNKVNFNFYNFTKKPDFFNQNFLDNYVNLLNSHYRLFTLFINRKQLKINNIEEFYNEFLLYIRKHSNTLPLTLYTSTTKKRFYYENTGLSISLDQKKAGDALNYLREFIGRQSETNAYIKIANLCGFEIDLANPYRMVYNPYRKATEVDVEAFYRNNFSDYFALEFSFLDSLVDTMYRQYTKDKFVDYFSEKNKVYIPNEECQKQIKTIKQNVSSGGSLALEQKLKLYLYAIASESNVPLDSKIDKIYVNAKSIAHSLDNRSAMLYALSQVRRLKRTTTFTREI